MKRIISLLFFTLLISSVYATTKPMFIKDLPTDINLVNTLDNFNDLPAASTSTILNGVSISTTSLVANTTTYTLLAGDYSDIIFPRNIVVDVYFSTGESTTTLTGTCIINGKNQFGNTITETINISTNSATSNVCWSTITSLKFKATAISGASTDANLYVGCGTKIALSNNIENATDIIKVIEAGAISTSYTINTIYDSIIFNSAPNGTNDYYIYYNSRTNKDIYKY